MIVPGMPGAVAYVSGGDPYWNSVVALLPMGGTPGSATFTDVSKSANNWTGQGSAQLSNAQAKFGSTSANFNGTTGYAQPTANSGFAFGTNDFTIEFWAYLINNSNYQGMYVDAYSVGITTLAIRYEQPSGSLGAWQNGETDLHIGSATVSFTAWHHIAFTRTGGANRVFLDGTKILDWSSAAGNITSNLPAIGEDQQQYFLDGYMQELRVTNGIARYTATFTAPSAPFPTKGNL